MQLTTFQFIQGQLAKVPPVVTQDLTGKTIVVVGANAGIGFEATKHFARMKPGRLVLACRSKSRGEDALERIKLETGCTTAELRLVDLTSFESVSTFAAAFNSEVDRLDILMLNAAILPQADAPTTKDGWETSFQTNNLSTSLLAILLLPKLSETASTYQTVPRVVFVASEVHYWAKLEPKMVDSPHPHRVFESLDYFNPEEDSALKNSVRYKDTKLLNIFFLRALASRSVTQSPSVVINAVNPGFWAALGSEGDDERALNGAYISAMSVFEPADSVISEEGQVLQNKLWDDLINELDQVNPNVRQIVAQYLK